MNDVDRALRAPLLRLLTAASLTCLSAACGGSATGAEDVAATLGDQGGDPGGNRVGKNGDGPAPDFSKVWGGEHIQLQIADSVVRIEYDCAHGTMTSVPTPRSDGSFATSGVHVFLHGGPVYEGEPEDRHPAEYRGTITGTTMTLRVRLSDSGTELGPFTMQQNHAGALFRCL